MIVNRRKDSYKLSGSESIAIAGVIEQFRKGNNVTTL